MEIDIKIFNRVINNLSNHGYSDTDYNYRNLRYFINANNE